MQKTSYIKTILQYIEKHLNTDISPESIANQYFISVSQLYRDFYSYTGHSIKQYIRKRRISNACEKIKCSDLPLSVIANESGYQTQQAFNKQFKSIVGMTPLQYGHSDTYFYFYPLSANEISIAVKVGSEDIPEWRTARFYDSRLSGIEDRAIASLKDIRGRVFGRNGKQTGNKFCYECMTEAGEGTKTGTYATCTVDYNERDIASAWNYLYNTWLPASMFEQSEDAYFEEYLLKNGKPCKLKLYLPVKKQKRAQHITLSKIPETAFITAKEKGPDAERKASESVISFLREHYPNIIQNARQFYVSSHEGFYECGVECAEKLPLPPESRCKLLSIPDGEYAVLPDDCLGDIGVGTEKINTWLKNNGIAHENRPAFAVYEAPGGNFDAENIRMKLYKLIKMTKKDNTGTPGCYKM